MKLWKLIIAFLFLFATIHLLRDILQIYSIDTPLATILKTNHTFCRPYCNVVTLPPEILIMVLTPFALRRKQFGKFGWGIVGVFGIWMGIYLWFFVKETILNI